MLGLIGFRLDAHSLLLGLTRVTPTPPSVAPHSAVRLPHVIIEQSLMPRRIRVPLIIMQRHEGSGAAVTQAAFSVNDLTATPTYLQLMQVNNPRNVPFACWALCGSQLLREEELIKRPTGQAINIVARPAQPRDVREPDLWRLDLQGVPLPQINS